MKKIFLTAIITTILIALNIVGCTSNDNSNSNNNSTKSTNSNQTNQIDIINDLMAKISQTVNGFWFDNLDVLREDETLNFELLTAWDNKWSSGPAKWFGIDFSQIRYTTQITNENDDDDLTIMIGDFEQQRVLKVLREASTDSEMYDSVEVWHTAGEMWEEDGFLVLDEEEGSVALLDDILLAGSEEAVKEALDVINSGKPSLLGDPDFVDIVNRLPKGFDVSIVRGFDLLFSTYDKAIVSGVTTSIKKDGYISTYVVKFPDIQTAIDNIQAIESGMQKYLKWMTLAWSEEGTKLQETPSPIVKQDGQFIEIVTSLPWPVYQIIDTEE